MLAVSLGISSVIDLHLTNPIRLNFIPSSYWKLCLCAFEINRKGNNNTIPSDLVKL
jgi:hypothetical protein